MQTVLQCNRKKVILGSQNTFTELLESKQVDL